MNRPVFLILIIFALSAPLSSRAGFWSALGNDLTSPVTTDAWTPFATGMIFTTALVILEDPVVDPTQSETVEDKPLGKSAKIGDLLGQGIPNALYVFGALGVGYFGESAIAYRRAQHMTLATIYSGVSAQFLKNIVREPRPNDWHDRVSFPSGHTTTAFAFASAVLMDHGWMWGVPAIAMATFVGYSRMNDNKHYIHDVVGGATLGIGYGLGIYYSMRNRLDSPGEFSLKNIYIAPNDEYGQSLVANFTY